MSLIYEKRVHSLEDRVDELERRVPDDLAAFIDELVERTARRVVELQSEQAEELRVAMAKRRADAGVPPDALYDEDDMCPNCCTPWKCNGPHLQRAGDGRWVGEDLCNAPDPGHPEWSCERLGGHDGDHMHGGGSWNEECRWPTTEVE